MKFNLDILPMTFIAIRFDEKTSEYIKKAGHATSDKLGRPRSNKPAHITLTDYEGKIDELVEKLNFVAETITPFDFDFWCCGYFITNGVVYISPRYLDIFRAMQFNLQRVLGEPHSTYFNQASWVPHCTVIKGLKKTEVSKATRHVAQQLGVFTARAVGFQTFTPNSPDKFIDFGGEVEESTTF